MMAESPNSTSIAQPMINNQRKKEMKRIIRVDEEESMLTYMVTYTTKQGIVNSTKEEVSLQRQWLTDFTNICLNTQSCAPAQKTKVHGCELYPIPLGLQKVHSEWG